MRHERIVIGVDFTEPSVAAARWTARYFAPDAELTLVHAVFAPEPPRVIRSMLPSSASLIEDARLGAEGRLRDLTRSIDRPAGDREVSCEVRVGSPAGQLLACAQDRGADLVVVGRHIERGSPRDWLGSTAESILSAAVVPVLLVSGNRESPPRHILLALDDDDSMPSVLRWARTLSERFSAHVLAMHVLRAVPVTTDLAMAQVGGAGMAADRAQLERELGAESLRWKQSVLEAGLPSENVRAETALGSPSHQIIETARRDDSDLIIIGNRRGPRAHTMLGTVARRVLRHAPCPVLTVTMSLDEIVDDEVDELLPG